MRVMFDRIRFIAVGVSVLMLLAVAALAADATRLDRPATDPASPPAMTAHPDDYTGWLRVYIVEPTARWKDNNSQPFHFGFLDFAVDEFINMPDGARLTYATIWDASAAGWPNTSETNLMAYGVLFNSEPHQAYSDPPSGRPFFAYYTDGAAAAVPGSCDSSSTDAGYTHTVFVHEGSTTWCPYCPTTSYWLHWVYENSNLNFHSVAMILDMNPKADAFMTSQYNQLYLPTTYGDGGDEILVGGWSPSGPYVNMINACGVRAIPDVNVMIALEFLGGDQYLVSVAAAHGTTLNTPPAEPSAPTGPGVVLVDTSEQYTCSPTDAEGDQLYCRWSWGDGDTTNWLGPYDSGDPVTVGHAWSAVGSYDIQVQSRDVFLGESNWSAPMPVDVICCQNRGNADSDCTFGCVTVSDLSFLVAYLFQDGPPAACEEEANADSDCTFGCVTVSDLSFLVGYLFQSGPAPGACPQ